MALIENDLRTEFDIHPPSPLYPGRFARLNGVDAELSADAVSDIADAGWLDDAGFLNALPSNMISSAMDLPGQYPRLRRVLNRTSIRRVRSELKGAYADHELYDDWASRCFDFFEAVATP